MKADNVPAIRAASSYYGPDSCTLEDLRSCVARTTEATDVPLAARIANNAPVYDCDKVRVLAATEDGRRQIMAEWIWVLRDGPGIVVLDGAFPDTGPVDAATAAFERMIAAQRVAGTGGGDHFAKPGANDRIWNALEKFCLESPESFARYYANEMIALISEAWLGPCYQVTSQINVVNPGGTAQTAHRDYHLGFQSSEVVARFPVHVHLFSPMLTLQGAVAHCDMPLVSGPTLYMPFSQAYGPGYLAAQDPEIRGWFNENCVQLPLRKGDAVFFNPALLHAAGTNRSADIRRMANLLQVSSAYGRAMESIDRTRMIAALYPVLRRMDGQGIDHAIAACAEGYSFPTNLDRDPPIGGLAPQSQQDLVREALTEGWDTSRFLEALHAQAGRRLS
ncbi:phytanoyl-CoA dioxygenase [Lichenicola cladoniae]|uniref:Phytanoyl-CoA dioxygenase n=1 Tax=Lichenicola cladoniae TaxID=1484109 RepID=A0A6M8HRG9_9PROT|nr:phytanoyl-CoA dioxygenase family protein [Lichenicola cladoniae]NPD69043.1 phytanoyl-CoA dioxygenase [Acetobacteraceae bacterium]QKE90875.1 phytanoyl-CoA dioxygenase [Lichenicola cladoniae]